MGQKLQVSRFWRAKYVLIASHELFNKIRINTLDKWLEEGASEMGMGVCVIYKRQLRKSVAKHKQTIWQAILHRFYGF